MARASGSMRPMMGLCEPSWTVLRLDASAGIPVCRSWQSAASRQPGTLAQGIPGQQLPYSLMAVHYHSCRQCGCAHINATAAN